MKLTCDICGASLQMTSGGKGAVCTVCGVAYDIERLKEKLSEASAPTNETKTDSGPDTIRSATASEENPVHNADRIPKDVSDTPKHNLRIKRLHDFHICKIAAFLDDDPAIILKGQGKTTTIPLSEGTHRIGFQVATGAGLVVLEEQTFTVTNYDWYGEIGLSRGAFKAAYTFKMQELR